MSDGNIVEFNPNPSPREVARRLKQVPIHVLISDVLQHQPLGTPCHELATRYLGKWQETHEQAETSYKLSGELQENISRWTNTINKLQDHVERLLEQKRVLGILFQIAALRDIKLLEYGTGR